MRTTLAWKLTLAFMLVALTTAALVAVFIRITSVDRLSQFLADQQRSSLQTLLAQYYTKHGSWDGIAGEWQQLRQQTYPTPAVPTSAANEPFAPLPDQQPRDPRTDQQPPDRQSFFGLVDAQGLVLVSYRKEYPAGSLVPQNLLKDGTPVTVDGKVVGTILNAPLHTRFNPEEALFLQRTYEALLYAVLGAMLVALIIGGILARTLTRPLKALTLASQNIAMGQLEQEVKVSSKDEIGRLALAFNRMSQEVARSNRLRRQMTADIAHDLRTPLLVIAGYIESMRDGVLQPTQQRLALIYSEIEHLQRLVNDLRMLSQADAGELPLHPQSFSPRLLLERAAASFVHQAETQNISLVVDAEESLPEVSVDEARMMQVFSNLLSNALRYTPAGGQIRLSARAEDGHILLSVRDNGSGIPAEELPHIFERFYRVDKARTDASETGLGLAIVKSLVEAQHGKVWAESKVGEYAEFNISI